MGWQDAPVVSDGGWQSAPIVGNGMSAADLRGTNPAEYDPSSPEYQQRYGITQGEANKGALAGNFLAIPRGLLKGATALATIPADAGIAIRNFATGSNYDSASSMLDQWLQNSGYGKATTVPEKVTEFASSIIGGMANPNPSIKSPAPPGFVKPPASPRLQTLQRAQQDGYVVPPTTSNPTMKNRVLEGLAGKLTTAQQASAKNTAVTNQLAARSIGLADDAPITPEAIRAVRSEASAAYEAIRNAGRVTADQQYMDDLTAIASKYQGPAKDFPEAAKSEVVDAVESIRKGSFDSSSAVDMVSILRDKADAAYSAGNKALGKAYKLMTKALEDALDRHLSRMGENGADMLNAYRASRQLIAKTYDVENALNPATGNIAASKIAAKVARGKPISGDLRTIGDFALAFPKAARTFDESLPGMSPLDFYSSAIAAGASGNPAPLAMPFSRLGARNYLLSPLGQAGAMPKATPEPGSMPWLYGLLSQVGQQDQSRE